MHEEFTDEMLKARVQEVLHVFRSEEKREIHFLDMELTVWQSVFDPVLVECGTDGVTRALPVGPGLDMLDIGTGTGCAAIWAAKHGCRHVYAVDINPLAVGNAKENIARHGVEDQITVLEGNLYDPLPPDVKFDIIYWHHPYENGMVGDLGEEGEKLAIAFRDLGYEKLRAFLSGARARLKPNGRLFTINSKDMGDWPLFLQRAEETGWSPKVVEDVHFASVLGGLPMVSHLVELTDMQR